MARDESRSRNPLRIGEASPRPQLLAHLCAASQGAAAAVAGISAAAISAALKR